LEVSLFNPEVVILVGGLYGSAAILLFAIELTITVCKLTPMRPEFRISRLGIRRRRLAGEHWCRRSIPFFKGSVMFF
jgi:hypothetical protein